MAKLNLAQAARATGKSRTTIRKWLKLGRIQAEMDGQGNWTMDSDELERMGWLLRDTSDVPNPPSSRLADEVLELKHQLSRLADQIAAKDELIEILKVDRADRDRIWKEYYELKEEKKLWIQERQLQLQKEKQLVVYEGGKKREKKGFFSFLRKAA